MPEIRHQVPGSAPGVQFAEIHIPNDEDWGTGTFTTIFAPDAFSSGHVVASVMFNLPTFGISVTVNPNRYIPVLLGRADGSPPTARKTFVLSVAFDASMRHICMAAFGDWQVLDLTMDDAPLAEKRIMQTAMAASAGIS